MPLLRLTALVCLLTATLQVAGVGETIRISTGEYAPWLSERLPHRGFTSHVIKEAFALEGYEVEFTFYPWKRAYESARDGQAFHATAYWYPSEERAEDFYYSDPLQTDRTVFFHLKDKPFQDWMTLDDLKGKRIGATREYTYTSEFWDAKDTGRLDIEIANSDVLNFNKLIKGRIDAFPTGDLVGQKLLREHFAADVAETVTFHTKPLVETTGHLLISRRLAGGAALLARFNRGLERLRDSGRYAELQADLIAGKYDR